MRFSYRVSWMSGSRFFSVVTIDWGFTHRVEFMRNRPKENRVVRDRSCWPLEVRLVSLNCYK